MNFDALRSKGLFSALFPGVQVSVSIGCGVPRILGGFLCSEYQCYDLGGRAAVHIGIRRLFRRSLYSSFVCS